MGEGSLQEDLEALERFRARVERGVDDIRIALEEYDALVEEFFFFLRNVLKKSYDAKEKGFDEDEDDDWNEDDGWDEDDG